MPKKKIIVNKIREEEAARRKVFMDKLRGLSPRELRSIFVEAGVLTPAGQLMPQYLK